MAGLTLVELRDRRGGLLARHRLGTLPVVIGRALDADVIVDDRYVDAHHLRLVADDAGGLVLEDLGSRNGTFDAVTGARVERAPVSSGSRFRLGESTLRILDPGHPVPPALPAVARRTALLARRGVAAAVVVGALAWIGISLWLESTERMDATEAIAGPLVLLGVLALWAGGWAFASRVFTGHARFLAHLAVASAATVAVSLLSAVLGAGRFLAPGAWIWVLLGLVAYVTLFAVVLGAHLDLVGAAPGRRRRMLAPLLNSRLSITRESGAWQKGQRMTKALGVRR